ncbi:MAG: PKD domain-containing protein [Cytophagales bacterium]|nr:PKD domain-containing protein [Cytophagales bacterium]
MNMNRGKRYSLVLLFVFSFIPGFAQNFSRHNWYFGNSPYGILFNKSDNQPNQTDTQATPYGNAASAVATDRVSGDLLFYTDGNSVYDATHQTMPSGVPLNGNANGNQGVAISPRPGFPGQYLILTNDAVYPGAGTVEFVIINMNLDGNANPALNEPPLGDMITAPAPAIPGQVNPGMLVFELGNDPYFYFLLVQDATTGEYLLYRIDGNNRVLIKSVPNPTNLVAANFSYHPGSGQIAVSPQNQGANVQILQFDVSTDTLAFVQEIPNTGNFDHATEAVYDVEFSPDGTKLFISRHGGGVQEGVLYRYDLTNPLASLDPVNPNPLFRSFGLQVGPDGRIYHLYQESNGGPLQVGRISNPNDTLASNINYQAVPLGNDDYVSTQFPAFAPPAPITFSPNTFEIVNQNTCEGSPTKFYPDFDPPADFYRWDFGDPASPDNNSNMIAPIHTYSGPGSYQVTLIAGINGSVDTVIQTVNVIQMMDSVDLGQDTVICPGESLVLDAGPNGQVYRWSTGETGQTITVDSSTATGYFWVVVDYGTCTSYDGINIEEYGEQVQVANYWYFGNNAGINFNEQPPVAVSDGQLITPEGAASISERNGENLFYTDGNIVYDQDHNVMFNGNNIGGDNNSTQSSLIVPFPDDETLFYIFTTQPVFNASNDYVLSYSVVDIKEIGNGTVGEVVTQDKPLFERSTERITATNPGGFVWLIAHEMGNNTFRAYPITDQGIGNPVLTSIGSSHDASVEISNQGYMKLSPDGSRLAVAFSSGGMNYVEIFDFDATTGTFSNYLQIQLPDNNPPYQVYGVEFSSNSEKLFVTANNPASPGSKLYELKLHDYDKDSVESRIVELADEPGVNMGAIQTGPDGQIYVARDGQQFLGTITENLDTLSNSTYLEDGFDLVTGTSSLGLPNFVQSFFQQTPSPAATVIPACVDQTTTFIGVGTSIIDEFLWTFGDGGSATTDSASHVYLVDSLYTVAFNVSNRCGLDTTIVQQVDISGYPDDATIPPVGVICDGPLILDADTTNSGGKQFIWSTGETTQSIQVTLPGDYSVRIINAAGCESEDTIQVFDGRPLFDLGPNITVCQGDSIAPLNTGLPNGSPPNTFTWRVNGNLLPDNTSFLVIDTNTPGIFEYTVNVIDGLTNCINDDTVTVTINPTPQAVYAVTNSNCGNSDGQIEVTSDLTNLSVEWFDASNISLGTAPILTSIPAGNYTLVVSDNISGCSRSYSINVVDQNPQFTIAVSTTPSCFGAQLEVTVTSTAGLSFSGGRYTLTDENSLMVYETDTIVNNIGSSVVIFSIDSIPGSTYSLLVSAFGCTNQQSSIVITDPATLPLSISPLFDVCTDDPTVSVNNPNPSYTYNWIGPDGTPFTGPSIQANQSGQYSVTATVGGIPCDTTAVTQVSLETSPDPLILPSTDGCDGTRQVGVANLSGSNYSYLWTTGETAPSITITTSQLLDIVVRDQSTGCQGLDTLQVDVYQPLNVAVTVDQQACQDGNLVTLTSTVTPSQSVRYEWYLNDVLLRDTTTNLSTFNEGLFRSEVTDVATGNCRASGELQIVRAPVTPSDIDPQYVICPEPPASEVAVIEPGDFITYLAFNIETGEQVFEALPGIFEITEEGNYNFELENAFNCWTLDTTMVQVDCIPTIYAPTAFSPWAQLSENQSFRLYPTYVGEFQIFIYNRWGELVYYSDDLEHMVNEGWNGMKDGKILPLGTYAYVIKFRSISEPERGMIEQPGGVTLIR